MSSTGSIFDAIVRFFREDDWHFEQLPGQPILRLGFRGKNGTWHCYALARESRHQFVFYSILDVHVPSNRRQAMAEFLTRANYGLGIGNFEMDFNDGEVRYKTSIDVEGDRLTSALIKHMVYLNVLTMDRYLPGIMSVAFGNANPAQAIAAIEDDSDDDSDV
jgi:hypothetical protein